MEVKDIFKLRKEGKIEEAYDAIRPLYAVHKGHYTTLCMFWVGVDMMQLRYQQRRLEEAYKIFLALQRLYPTMDDQDKRGQSAMMRAAILVFDHNPKFSMLRFITEWNIARLTDDDWMTTQIKGHPTQSLGMRIVGKVFKEVRANPTTDMALAAAPILAEALRHSPYNMNNQRYKAIVYTIMGKKDKAANIYRHLIRHHHQSYLYQELADLTADTHDRIALLSKAIISQHDQRFTQRMHWQLANLLYDIDRSRARYELDKSVSLRKESGYDMSFEMQNLQANLADVVPVTEQDQRHFYHLQSERVSQMAL